MQYGQIPGLDKKISRIVQGTVYFSELTDDVRKLYDAVFEGGVNTFDTAHGYGRGKSEKTLGAWIKERGNREDVVILDKGAHPYDGQVRVTPEFITSDLTESLESLQTDYVDLYILHRDDETKPVEPIVDVLNEHHKAGRIRAFGGSNWRYERIKEANAYAEANGLVPFVASSPQFSLAEMFESPWDGCISVSGDSNQAAREWYQSEDVALFTWSSLAGGFMTGKFRRDNLEGFTGGYDLTTIKAYCHEPNFERLERAAKLAEQKGVALPQLALAYVLNQPLNIYAIVGNRQPSEFEVNSQALSISLTPEELAWLDLKADALPA